MVRRAENVDVVYVGGFSSWFTGSSRLRLWVGRKSYLTPQRWKRSEFDAAISTSGNVPVCFMQVGERAYWLFQGKWYWDNENLSGEDVHALLVTRDDRRKASINRAKSMVAMEQRPQAHVRGAIPPDVKQIVWKRDGGTCRECGSNVELQFDHIIPFSMGGASNEENLQILCGPCNRRKGASVV